MRKSEKQGHVFNNDFVKKRNFYDSSTNRLPFFRALASVKIPAAFKMLSSFAILRLTA